LSKAFTLLADYARSKICFPDVSSSLVRETGWRQPVVPTGIGSCEIQSAVKEYLRSLLLCSFRAMGHSPYQSRMLRVCARLVSGKCAPAVANAWRWRYYVGYRKPPKGSQLQKGKSGNSSGRPKQDPGIAAVSAHSSPGSAPQVSQLTVSASFVLRSFLIMAEKMLSRFRV